MTVRIVVAAIRRGSAPGRNPPAAAAWSISGGADLVCGPAQRVFEKRQQQLVLSVELEVETPQRLTRPVDDFLNGEVGAPLFDDEPDLTGERRVVSWPTCCGRGQ
jgi:hypothetical protein